MKHNTRKRNSYQKVLISWSHRNYWGECEWKKREEKKRKKKKWKAIKETYFVIMLIRLKSSLTRSHELEVILCKWEKSEKKKMIYQKFKDLHGIMIVKELLFISSLSITILSFFSSSFRHEKIGYLKNPSDSKKNLSSCNSSCVKTFLVEWANANAKSHIFLIFHEYKS